MKKLLIFTTWQAGDDIDLSPQSNLWYIQRYGSYFAEVTHVFLCGRKTEKVVRNGAMSYVSLGTGNNKLDLLLSPYRLYKFARAYKPYAYLTCEQVWFFWVVILIKLLLRAKVYLLPITYPEAMYKMTKKSLTTVLPIWVERLLLAISYRLADKVITARNVGDYVEWISSDARMKHKKIIVDALPESIPTVTFFDSLKEADESSGLQQRNGVFKLIYVGRLHNEKLVDHLIKMVALLKEQNANVKLTLIGDGSDRNSLENLAKETGVENMIDFLGWKANNELPKYFKQADAFVSSSAGGSLREAALCGLPVVSYDSDWIKGLLKDRETFLAVTPENFSEMADKVLVLMNDRELHEKLSHNLKTFAWNYWSDVNMEKSLHEIYD